jgi:hypothetical protein
VLAQSARLVGSDVLWGASPHTPGRRGFAPRTPQSTFGSGPVPEGFFPGDPFRSGSRLSAECGGLGDLDVFRGANPRTPAGGASPPDPPSLWLAPVCRERRPRCFGYFWGPRPQTPGRRASPRPPSLWLRLSVGCAVLAALDVSGGPGPGPPSAFGRGCCGEGRPGCFGRLRLAWGVAGAGRNGRVLIVSGGPVCGDGLR